MCNLSTVGLVSDTINSEVNVCKETRGAKSVHKKKIHFHGRPVDRPKRTTG